MYPLGTYFLLFAKAILGENGQKWSIYGFLSERQKQRGNKFDHGLISLYELKNHLRFVLCKKTVVENDDYNNDNYDNDERMTIFIAIVIVITTIIVIITSVVIIMIMTMMRMMTTVLVLVTTTMIIMTVVLRIMTTMKL